MERNKIYNLIAFFLAILFLTLGILNQFNILSIHYIFNWISYVIAGVTLIVSFIKKLKLKQRLLCILISVITLIISLITHFTITNSKSIYSFKMIDGGIEITGYIYKLTDTHPDHPQSELIIPNKIMGKDVKVIGEKAFLGYEFYNVIIPDTVEIIEEYAFLDTRIRTLTLSNNTKIIGEKAFSGCKLYGLVLPDTLEEIGNLAFNFNRKSHVDFINVPKSVKKIGELAFPEMVICLEGDSVVSTGTGVSKFYSNSNFVYYESIAYKEDKIVYALHKDKTATLAHVCPDCTNLEIPKTIIYNNEVYNITSIGSEACVNTKIEEVIIPSSIKTIGQKAFAANRELKYVCIPSSVVEMGDYVFYNSRNVKINIESLDNINNWSEVWNDVLLNTKLEYTYNPVS